MVYFISHQYTTNIGECAFGEYLKKVCQSTDSRILEACVRDNNYNIVLLVI